jgi:hypothetical protein
LSLSLSLSFSRLAANSPISHKTSGEKQVNGKGNTLYGDGFAVWLTKDRAKPGPVFGSVGEWLLIFLIPVNPTNTHTHAHTYEREQLFSGIRRCSPIQSWR